MNPTGLIDITRTLSPGHPNWPGDTPFSLTPSARIAEGSSVNLMTLHTSTHCGTHLDAPYHYREDGAKLDALPLSLLVGSARVLHPHRDPPGAPVGAPLGVELLAGVGELPPRVLISTGEPDRWDAFPETFRPLTPELVHALAERGVRLVGTDAPSVDAFSSTTLPVHHACGERGLAIVEGLRLGGVEPGDYRLICLPLALHGADASPVRAVLEASR